MMDDTDSMAYKLGFVGMLALYVVLRLLAWNNTLLLEDHDSILYIRQIQAYLSFDAANIFALSPDSTPFYPFFSALASLAAGSAEAGARLFSLICSIALFLAVAGILRRIAPPATVLLGLFVLSVLPYLIRFSISILSEPAYLAMIYLGFWYFLSRYRSDSLWSALVIGLIFGLSFLNRLEGLLFLLLIPAFRAAYIWYRRDDSPNPGRDIFRWCAVYSAGFIILAAPQVLTVSAKMNQFALNGRTVWAQILQSPDPGSFDEKIYGLDHSPHEINLTYLQRHPEAASRSSSGLSLSHQTETVLRNIDTMYALRIGPMGGSLLITFFFFGLVSLYKRRLYFEAAYMLLFAAAAIAPGILTDPKPRALAAALPLIAGLSGVGIAFVSGELGSVLRRRWAARYLPVVFLGVLLLLWLVPFLGIYLKERRANVEYSLDDLAPLQTIVADISDRELRGTARITARKQYLAYLSNSEFSPLPFTDYAGLLEYVRGNDVDLLYLQYRYAGEFPFMEDIANDRHLRDWRLLYEGTDSGGLPLELYLAR